MICYTYYIHQVVFWAPRFFHFKCIISMLKPQLPSYYALHVKIMLLSNDKFLVRPTHSLQIGINSKSDTEQDLDAIKALWLASQAS